MEYDVVKNPSHYTAGRKFEPKDVIRDWQLNFNLGNAVKYLSRAGHKDDIIQDLKKAQTYIQFEIDAIEAERKAKDQKGKPQRPPLFSKEPMVKESERYKVIKMEVPKGSSPEDVIAEFISRLYGGGE